MGSDADSPAHRSGQVIWVPADFRSRALLASGAGMTFEVNDALSTGVIPAKARTQYTEPQVGGLSAKRCPCGGHLFRDPVDKWRQDFGHIFVAT